MRLINSRNLNFFSITFLRKIIRVSKHIIAILDGSNNFVAGYAYGPGTDDPLVLVTDYNEDGKLDTLNLVKDHQNSVKLVMDGTKVLQEMTYSAYGETSIGNRGQDKISTNNVFYYTSRELEPETGDYFYRARYYDPKVGRFLSEDPIHFAGGDYNLYRYVGNQPVVSIDPSGLQPMDNEWYEKRLGEGDLATSWMEAYLEWRKNNTPQPRPYACNPSYQSCQPITNPIEKLDDYGPYCN